jgi:hypothetical protein
MNDAFNDCREWKEMAEKARTSVPTPFRPKEKKAPRGSAQVLEKVQNGQENPRKSKHFPLIDLAGFGRA